MTDLSRRKFFKLAAGTAAAASMAGSAAHAVASFIQDDAGSWLVADGSTLPIVDYGNLFSVMGRNYGGDQLTFNLPKLSEFGAGLEGAGIVPVRYLIKARSDDTDNIMPIGSIIAWVGDKLPRQS